MDCTHDGYHCSKLILERHYAVTCKGKFVRWSDENDPPFPCLCKCPECEDWRSTQAEIDGPVILPIA